MLNLRRVIGYFLHGFPIFFECIVANRSKANVELIAKQSLVQMRVVRCGGFKMRYELLTQLYRCKLGKPEHTEH